jgi:peptide/nickel transport system substrate-binding protein
MTEPRPFRIGLLKTLERRDPRGGVGFMDLVVQWHVYEPPYRALPQSNKIEPVLLEYPLRADTPGPDALSYSARVRKGVCFSDGTEVTAEHVASSLNQTPSIAPLASASAQGDRVVFRLSRPDAKFEFALARQDHPIVLAKGNEYFGTGPYKIASGSQPDSFRLVKNPYYKGQVGIGEIECRVFPPGDDGRPQKLVEALGRGEIDFTDVLSREELNQVHGMRKSIDLGFCTAVLFFNTERPLFKDARARRAFAQAINRPALAGTSYSSASAFAATGLLPPMLGSTPDGIPFDLPGAKALLREASVVAPTAPLLMVTVPVPRPHLPQPRVTGNQLAAQLGELGFRVEVTPARDVAHYFELAGRGSYDLFLSGWIPDTPDPLDFMEALLASRSVPTIGPESKQPGRNLSRWRSPEMDAALDRQRRQREQSSWREISDLLRSQVPLFPLMYGPRVVVLSRRIKKVPEFFGYRPFLAELEV